MMVTNKTKYFNIFYLIVLVLLVFDFNAKSQQTQKYPEVGQQCPDFRMNAISGNVREVSLTSLKGKYFILDFWTVACVPCVASFPVVDSIQNLFPEDLRIIHVGTQQKDRDVVAFYKKFEKKFNIKLISGIDSNVFRKFVHGTVPFAVWVDKDSKIKAITGGSAINVENVRRFIRGEDFAYTDASFVNKERVKPSVARPKEITLDQVIANPKNVLLESKIQKSDINGPRGNWPDINSGVRNSTFIATRMDLVRLYNLAYFGSNNYLQNEFYPIPILSVKDSAFFKWRYDKTSDSLFNYILYSPRNRLRAEDIMNRMKDDLNKAFGYDVQVINAEMPCMKLIITDSLKLWKAISRPTSRIPETNWTIESGSNVVTQIPVNSLALLFSMYLPFPMNSLSYDESGIDKLIDIKIEGDISSVENIRKQIRKIGIDFIYSTKLSRVLKISDPM